MRKLQLPSPAMAVALVALFVALSGTAFAVGDAIVPLAKRALTADKAKVATVALTANNAKKLGGQDAAALVSQASAAPGPASTAAGLVTIKTATWSLNGGQHGNFTAACDAGQKVVGGGWTDPADWSFAEESNPTADGAGWAVRIFTVSFAPGGQTGTVFAICLK